MAPEDKGEKKPQNRAAEQSALHGHGARLGVTESTVPLKVAATLRRRKSIHQNKISCSRAATKVVLVLGGARSGKSTYAFRLAESEFKHPVYLATAEALDAEMAERIELHRKTRGRKWICVEQPLNIAGVIRDPPRTCDGILLDCLTMWLSNILLKEGESSFEKRRNEFLAALQGTRVPAVIVSNEVGMGIVPENELGRKFRDLAGWLNQDVAEIADRVVFVAAGLPMVLKEE